MPMNTSPIFTLTPNVSSVIITQASANVKSDGTGTIGTDIFLAFTPGSNGSYIDRIRFSSVASAAATNSVATTLRIFLSTKTSGVTAPGDTWLLMEVSVPIIATDHSTNATPSYEVSVGIAIPSTLRVLVSQHIAQTANQNWNATVVGGDY